MKLTKKAICKSSKEMKLKNSLLNKAINDEEKI